MEELKPVQVRILGCLIEKELTTPDQYPLTENALKNAANQKTNRFPLMNLTEGEIGHALRELESKDLVRRAWSTRAVRWEHRLAESLGLLTKHVAILTTLMLRGAQTAAEIRAHCARLHEFDDVDDVEYELGRMIERDPPLVCELPRIPGRKGQRYDQLLAGEPDLDNLAPLSTPTATVEQADLMRRVEQLEDQVADLLRRLDDGQE